MSRLTSDQRRHVCLFAEALLLIEEGGNQPWDRLQLVERSFGLSLVTLRRTARKGRLELQHLSRLDADFGISAEWIVSGDADALFQRIVEFSRERVID